jgi:hypothetical protein
MKLNTFVTAFAFTVLGGVMAPVTASADGVTFVRGQFTSRVERGQPVGDTAAAGRQILYWMEIGNAGAPTQVTLVWKVGGRAVTRQSLDVGRAPRWRTWGVFNNRGGNIEVEVLDAAGASLHTEQLTR